METIGLPPWRFFEGTLEEWIPQQKQTYQIVTPHAIINGADCTLNRIAVDKAGNKVAEEVASVLTGIYCIILV